MCRGCAQAATDDLLIGVYWIAKHPVFAFSVLSAATFPLQGVFNFIFWGIIMERYVQELNYR